MKSIGMKVLEERFGDDVPMEAVKLLWTCPPDWTIERLKAEIEKIAAKRDESTNYAKRLYDAACDGLEPTDVMHFDSLPETQKRFWRCAVNCAFDIAAEIVMLAGGDNDDFHADMIRREKYLPE